MVDVTLDTLTSRGALAASDQFPVLPTGAGTLLKDTLGDVQNFVLTSVKQFGAAGDGVHDDTTAIQAAINSGLAIWFPPGVYIISTALLAQTYANCGQIIRGSGSYYGAGSVGFSATPPPGTTVIRPTSAVTSVFIIDGTPIGGAGQTWVQGFGIENLAIDMVNMTDVATNAAIKQIQAFDCYYQNVRIMRDGVNKRGWLFQTGAYTTQLTNTQCNFIECTGTSTSNGVTTLNILNHDGNQLWTNYTNSVTVLGGTWQGAGVTHFKFRNGTDFWLKTDVEGTGVFLDADNSTNNICSRCELQGFTGTPYILSTAPSSDIRDNQVNFNTYPFNLRVGYVNFNNQGAAGISTFYSGAANANYALQIGRTGNDAALAVAAATNDWVPGTVSGDVVLEALTGTLFLAGAQVPNLSITATGVNSTGTGILRQGQVVIQPAADAADLFVVKTAGALGIFDISTNVVAGSSKVEIAQGAQFIGYSDGFATQTFRLDTAAGNINAITGAFLQNGTQVVGARRTGWTAPTGAVSRATFDQSTVTLPGLAQALAALIADLTTHGLIGP